ncbi:hypothetical protein [Fibrisoma limi]|uniref:hypothetical protein n=1 Tax=Fibrisoma limi TaxID=663275 RepID=UPI000587590D|nr:hypothetical protein [Fibrisoma limi]
MTAKDNKQNRMSKRSKSLMSRFRVAYERMNHSQRQIAQKAFCEAHHVTPGTFRNKMNGFTSLFEAEVEWMEAHDPYAQPQTA